MRNRILKLLALAAVGSACLLGYVKAQWPEMPIEDFVPTGKINRWTDEHGCYQLWCERDGIMVLFQGYVIGHGLKVNMATKTISISSNAFLDIE